MFCSLIQIRSSIPKPPFKALLCIWLIACSLAFFSLGELPLRDFDEGTVARVALELSEKTGFNRLLPTLWNQPYLNKPPGLHWFISMAINLSRRLGLEQPSSLPSEFCIRFFPAIFSTCVVPLGGLIQWHLRPKDKISPIASSLILLTLLPIVRHGRLAMLDGTQLSAIALLWLFLVSLDQSKRDKYRLLGAGFACSFMLLLKAPLMIPALVAALIPLLWEKKFKNKESFYYWGWFVCGLIPGVSWHCLNAIANGSGALWLWWGDGAGRVLFHSGSGSDLGFWVPIIEVLEGGWPWIVLWPFGITFAWRKLYTRWGSWALFTQIVLGLSVLPLKTQLPWYGHPLWLPFALLCGPPVSWLIQRNNFDDMPAKKILSRVPLFWSFLGALFILIIFLDFLGITTWISSYLAIILPIAIGWFVGGMLIKHHIKNLRQFGFLSIVLGSLIGFFILMGSNFWLWELNENWDVLPVANIVSEIKNEDIYITGSFERPSLNWYAGKQIKRLDSFIANHMFLKRKNVNIFDLDQKRCRVIRNANEWDLLRCNK